MQKFETLQQPLLWFWIAVVRKISAHANWGPSPGSAHARPSAQPPIDVSGNFPAQVSAESPSKISPNPSEVISEVSEPYFLKKT
jgi:hypothetical protein